MFTERTCEEIAELVGGQLIGKSAQKLSGVSSLKEAMATDVSFLGNEKYRPQVLPSKAGAILVPMNFDEPVPEGRAWIKCENPSQSFTKVIAIFTPPPMTYAPGIAKSACIAESAEIGEGVHIGENVVIGERVKIGANTAILPGVVLCDDVRVGENCLFYPNVVIRERCVVANRVIMHPGVVIGGDGYGYDSGPEGHKKIPQVGIVQIDDDVEIGSNTTIDRARFGRTWIQAGIAGSTILGAGVIVAGQVGISGHLHVADGSILMAQSGISKDVPPKSILFGSPAKPRREYAKEQMYLAKIESLVQEVEELKKRLG